MLDERRGCKVSSECDRWGKSLIKRQGDVGCLTSAHTRPTVEVDLYKANPTSGGVTASTEMLAAKRHAGVHTPVIACKTISANQQMAYAA